MLFCIFSGLLLEICRSEFESSSIVSVVVRKTEPLGGSEFAGTNIVHKWVHLQESWWRWELGVCLCLQDNCSQHSNSHSLLTPTYPLCDTQNLMPTIPSLSPPAITVILLHTLPPKLRPAISRRRDVSAKYTRRLLKEDIGCFSADSDKRGPLSGYMGSTLYVSSKCPFWVAS